MYVYCLIGTCCMMIKNPRTEMYIGAHRDMKPWSILYNIFHGIYLIDIDKWYLVFAATKH